jgi:TonB-dependent starch-binding outer membrane protein SusC
MKKILSFTAIILISALTIFSAQAENKGEVKNSNAKAVAGSTIKGKVIDQLTNEPLAGVKIQIEGTSNACYTDLEGNFNFGSVKPGNYNLATSLISYEHTTFKNVSLESGEDHSLKMVLKPLAE